MMDSKEDFERGSIGDGAGAVVIDGEFPSDLSDGIIPPPPPRAWAYGTDGDAAPSPPDNVDQYAAPPPASPAPAAVIATSTTSFPVPRKNKADANVAEAVEVVTLDMPALKECELLKNVLLGFKDPRFKELLKAKIGSTDITDEKKQQVKTLLTLIEAANVQYLETHFLTGQDKDDRYSS